MRKFGSIILLVLHLAGCGHLTEHQPASAPLVPIVWQNVAPQATRQPEAGWHQLSDPHLDALIKQALAGNRDLVKMAIRLQRASLQSEYANQNKLPAFSVSGGVNVQRKLTSSDRDASVQVNGINYQIPANGNIHAYFVSAGLNYEVDIWSRIAHLIKADSAGMAAAAADLEAAKLILVTSVAQHYWHIALQDEEIAAVAQGIAQAETTLAHGKLRKQVGTASTYDVLQIESSLIDRRAYLNGLKQRRLEETYALAMLLDEPPENFVLPEASLPMAPMPGISAGLPIELLDRRPDLRAARLRLDEVLYRLNASEVARYPQFTLTSSINTSSTALRDALSNPLASAGLNVVLPFIDWRRMRIARDSSRTQYLEAEVEFRETLYKALVEVETALSASVRLSEDTKHAGEDLAFAAKQEKITLLRYQSGATGQQSWLDEQEKYRGAALRLSRQRVAELDNFMGLYKALGFLF